MTSPASGSAVPALVTPHVSSMQLVVNVGTGAALAAGSAIVTDLVVVAVTFHSSLTVRTTTKVPAAVNVLVRSGPVAVPCPVPKVHEYVNAEGFSSVDPRPSNEHTFSSQDTSTLATGGLLAGWVAVTPFAARMASDLVVMVGGPYQNGVRAVGNHRRRVGEVRAGAAGAIQKGCSPAWSGAGKSAG